MGVMLKDQRMEGIYDCGSLPFGNIPLPRATALVSGPLLGFQPEEQRQPSPRAGGHTLS